METNEQTRLTPAPVGQGLHRSAQARFAKNGSKMRLILNDSTAVAEPIRQQP
jgi:hypothetical protein